jgi:hypothetical protein
MRKIILRVLLVFVLAAVCLTIYLIGYGRGHSAAVHDQLVFDLRSNLLLCRLGEEGDTNRLQSMIRFLVFCDSDYYDRYFSGETVTNKHFIKDLLDARAIASEERTQVVSLDSVLRQVNEEIQTNRRPNTALTPTATAPSVSTNK